MPDISLIIRTHNEEKWIGECLRTVADQSLTDFEVILVDNLSTDKTVEKARHVYPELTLVQIDDYYPGLALNEGIRASDGTYIVCLSAHCIPVNDQWLTTLRRNFEEHDDIAGAYGRQVPTEASDPIDKRDLIRTFGLEKRIQTEDTFFHNANSIVRRDVWEEYPFDEEVTNIEDQIWANEVLNAGYKIVYEPDAAVYHHHGINQGNDRERTQSVVRTMENNVIQEDELTSEFDANPLDPVELDIVCFIPLRQKTGSGVDSNETLITRTLDATKDAEYIDDTFIASDAEYVVEKSDEWDITETFLRPPELSEPNVPVVRVHEFALDRLEDEGRFPDLVVTADITHPFRPTGFLDELVEELLGNGYDSIVPTYPERRPAFLQEESGLRQINESDVRSKRKPVQISLLSLGCVTYPDNIRRGDRLSGDVGVYEIDNPLATIEIRNRDDLRYWERLRGLPDLIDENQSSED